MLELIKTKRLFFYGVLACIAVQLCFHILKDHYQLDLVNATQDMLLQQLFAR